MTYRSSIQELTRDLRTHCGFLELNETRKRSNLVVWGSKDLKVLIGAQWSPNSIEEPQ